MPDMDKLESDIEYDRQVSQADEQYAAWVQAKMDGAYRSGYHDGYNDHAKARAKGEAMFGKYPPALPLYDGIPDNAWHA